MRCTLSVLSLLFAHLMAYSQNTYDIRDAGDQFDGKCGECLALFERKPKEVHFGFITDADGGIWFVTNDTRFFEALITKPSDGLAVDIVRRNRYTCGVETPEQTTMSRGTLLKPAYQFELKRSKQAWGNGVAVKVGVLPKEVLGTEYELNLMVLKDRFLCYYNWFYDLQVYRWDLLNMGLYMDTLTYGEQYDTTRTAARTSTLRRKALHFTIPFERNKAEYSPADLQPMRDSLRLTDFTIKRIVIEAYSSVEGPEDRNLELQQKRAQSIVDAMQTYQSQGIATEVHASENWVEFLSDVLLTPHAALAGMSKAAIKKKLTDKRLADALEPMLAHHRKAVITLELARKDGLDGVNAAELIEVFEKAIADNNLERAIQVQNAVFDRILDNQLPSSYIDQLEVPSRTEFAQMMHSRVAFRQFMDPTDAWETYLALEELDRLLPEDGHIKYNMCAVKFRLWLLGGHTIDPAAFKKEIEHLRIYHIEEPLIKRMLINWNIMMAEGHMAKGEYTQKDECLKYIQRNYKSIPMSEQDHLSLAQYFAGYANYNLALNVVEPRLFDIQVDEDLLFYYLNLTIADPERTKEQAYRTIMLNAINKDKPRFCSLFKPFGMGGVTFQLLDDTYLMKTYCETCE